MTYVKRFPKKLTVSETSKPTSPNYKLKNPLNVKAFVAKIEVIPNYQFADKGKIIIKKGNQVIFSNDDDEEYLSDIVLDEIPLDDGILDRHQSIEVFAWNDEDSNIIAVTVNITISDEKVRIPSKTITISRNEKNRGTPETLTLTSPDGGSGIIATAYTCPAGFQAKVIEFVSLVDSFGATDEIDLWLVDTRMARWHLTAGDRRLKTILYSDFAGQELDEGESIYFDGDFPNNFNATIKVAYTVLETRKL